MITHNYDNYYGIQAKINRLPHLNLGQLAGTIVSNVGNALNLGEHNLSERFGVSNYVPQAYASGPATSGNSQRVANTYQPVQTSAQFTPQATQTTSTNNTTYSPTPTNNNNDTGQSSGPSAEEIRAQQLRNEISSAWDSYLGSFGAQEQAVAGERDAMSGIANTNLQQNKDDLNTSKASSLKDIYSTARNALSAGNNYLGQLGAGDSSANGMFNYAVNRQATEQVGNLNNFVTAEMGKVDREYENQIFGIQQWFSQQQQALAQAKQQGQLQKGLDIAALSKDLLQNALNEAAVVKQEAANRRTALEQWAMNMSTNVGQLQQNIAAIPQAMGQLSTFGGPTRNISYGGTSAEEDRI